MSDSKSPWSNLGSRERNLLILIAVLAPFALWQYIGPMLGSGAAVIGGSNLEERQSLNLEGVEIIEPELTALQAERGQYAPGRNLFDFASAPPPPRPKPTPPKPVVRKPQPPKPQPVAPPPPPGPPPLTLTVSGVFGPDARRIAVVRSGEALLNAMERDVIDGKFIVHQIGYETVAFTFVGFPDAEPQRVTIGE